MLKKIRTSLAVVMFICITWLFVDFTGTAHHQTWIAMMPKMQLLEAILALNVTVIIFLVTGTLVFGRIYCSVICPLGVFQDVIARFNRKKNKYSYSKALSWLRYTMLGVMVVALVAGIGSVFQLLAPYSAYGRIATMIFQPVYKAGNNVLATLAERADSYAFYHVEQIATFGAVLIIAIATFVILAILAFRNGRTYCNTICPVGTILSFFARFSFFRIQFDKEKCKNCSLCEKNCKASAIDYKSGKVDYSRCVTCGDCTAVCKFDALHFRLASPIKKESNQTESQPDNSRRAFLTGAAVAIGSAAMAETKIKVDGGLAVIEDKQAPQRVTPITPPGSVSARNMQKHCTACQLCVSACPNDVLRPSTDPLRLMQPEMSFERGYCRPECTRCSNVCPTGAIHSITREDKTAIHIGHAVWIEKNCIPVVNNDPCGACARHCPASAIQMVDHTTSDGRHVQVPAIDKERCIGCGKCENLCPSRPFSAIYVEGNQTHHIS